jgi:hypothetical protein
MQQQKTIHGSICIFLEPWLQFWIVGLAPFILNFLSFSASQVLNKTASTKMDQDKCAKL